MKPDGQTGAADEAESPSRMLTDILAEIRGGKRRQAVDVVIAVVISLAALASAWCAYQSSRWNGAQLSLVGEADFRVVESTRHFIEANQLKTGDLMLLLQVIDARSRGDAAVERVIRERLRPESRAAIEGWLASDPLHNPDAPREVFAGNAAYQLADSEAGARLEAEAKRAKAAANEAGAHGDRYTLLALLFAAVMFVGGIAGTFDARGLRVLLGAVACALFCVTAAALAMSPVCAA